MQKSTVQDLVPPTLVEGLLAGSILEEYRDLLSLDLLSAAKKKSQVDSQCCNENPSCGRSSAAIKVVESQCCTVDPSCGRNSAARPAGRPKPKTKKKAESWIDLPRAESWIDSPRA